MLRSEVHESAEDYRVANAVGGVDTLGRRDAIDSWLRFYERHKGTLATSSLSTELSRYNQYFFDRIVENLIPKLRTKEPVRLWSAGSGIDCLSLKLKAIYGNSIEVTITDVSGECMNMNRRMFEENGLSANFIVADLFEESHTDAFDIVYNTGLLEHFQRTEQEMLLRTFSDSLQWGGAYMTCVPHSKAILYTHCMRRMKARNAWPFGPETPIATFASMHSWDMMLTEETPFDATHQLTFIKPAYPLLGTALLPVILAATKFHRFLEPSLLRLIDGYCLYARYEKRRQS
jgi:2-polyprenyl-3-methyl-5-hydroxy-6-metoxy-1,4-benzoquinol methylase